MNTAKVYQDSEGNDCSIVQMVRREPDWAANRVQVGEKAIEFGANLAYKAERFIAAVNNLDRVNLDDSSDQNDIEDAEQSRSEWWSALENAIHEFRKRT